MKTYYLVTLLRNNNCTNTRATPPTSTVWSSTRVGTRSPQAAMTPPAGFPSLLLFLWIKLSQKFVNKLSISFASIHLSQLFTLTVSDDAICKFFIIDLSFINENNCHKRWQFFFKLSQLFALEEIVICHLCADSLTCGRMGRLLVTKRRR